MESRDAAIIWQSEETECLEIQQSYTCNVQNVLWDWIILKKNEIVIIKINGSALSHQYIEQHMIDGGQLVVGDCPKILYKGIIMIHTIQKRMNKTPYRQIRYEKTQDT